MEVARRSFRADIEAGFGYLHVGPTRCPWPHSPDDLVAWTAALLAFCEKTRAELGLDTVDYEVGTEDVQGTVARFRGILGSVSRRRGRILRRMPA